MKQSGEIGLQPGETGRGHGHHHPGNSWWGLRQESQEAESGFQEYTKPGSVGGLERQSSRLPGVWRVRVAGREPDLEGKTSRTC